MARSYRTTVIGVAAKPGETGFIPSFDEMVNATQNELGDGWALVSITSTGPRMFVVIFGTV